MALETIYLDVAFRQSLESIAYSDGWLNYDVDGDAVAGTFFPRNKLRRKTLLLMTLFERIDSSHTDYDVERLIAEGIVGEDAEMVNGSQGVLHDDKSSARLTCSEIARRMVTGDAERIATEYMRTPEYQAGPALSMSKLVEECRKMMDQFHSDNFGYITYSSFHGFATYVEARFGNLEDCLYYSIERNASFASQLYGDAATQNPSPKTLDDVYVIAKTKLTDEILYLPDPRNLNDVLRLRESREIKRFRQVLAQWCETLHHGSDQAELKMRTDVRKANVELKRLAKWREWQSSPINFVINSVGGHVPVLSNILSVVATIGGLYQFHVESRHNWTMLGVDSQNKSGSRGHC